MPNLRFSRGERLEVLAAAVLDELDDAIERAEDGRLGRLALRWKVARDA